MYRMHRIFCATAWETEGERRAFYDLLGEFNETHGIPAGTLYVPVSLININDKRPYQYTVEDNIRQCLYYILVPGDDWGPPERCFERDYRFARNCAADPALPMRESAILLRNQPDGSPPAFAAVLDAAGHAYTRFTVMEDFQAAVSTLLHRWIAAELPAHGPGAARA